MISSDVYNEQYTACYAECGDTVTIIDKNGKIITYIYIMPRKYNYISAIKFRDEHYALLSTEDEILFAPENGVSILTDFDNPLIFSLTNGFVAINGFDIMRLFVNGTGGVNFKNKYIKNIRDIHKISLNTIIFINENDSLEFIKFSDTDESSTLSESYKKAKYFINNDTFVSNVDTIYKFDNLSFKLASPFPINYFKQSLSKADVIFLFD